MSEPTTNTPNNTPNLHIDRYEAAWIRISLITVTVFALAVVTASVTYGIHLPGVHGRINPNTLLTPPSPFANPEVREISAGKYEAYIRSQVWSFLPGEIHVPAGSEITFYVTSMDVQHGFKIMDTNINMMVLPGQISTLKTKFDKPGTYNFICTEFCGAGGEQIGHHTMFGKIIVE